MCRNFKRGEKKMINTSNMGRGEEIAIIMRNIDKLYPNIAIINNYDELHEKAIQEPQNMTKDELFSVVIAECKELMNVLGENIYDDPCELILDYTEPYEDITIEKAKRIMKEIEKDGYHLPPWFTAQDFIEVYKDCEPIE